MFEFWCNTKEDYLQIPEKVIKILLPFPIHISIIAIYGSRMNTETNTRTVMSSITSKSMRFAEIKIATFLIQVFQNVIIFRNILIFACSEFITAILKSVNSPGCCGSVEHCPVH